MVFDLAAGEATMVLHRAEFLVELMKPVPKELLHTGKKLVGVTATDDGSLLLRFEDGTTEPADALIGADGTHSYVRKQILGDHTAAEPVFAGWWDCRNLVPFEKAKEVLGEEYLRRIASMGGLGMGVLLCMMCLMGERLYSVSGQC